MNDPALSQLSADYRAALRLHDEDDLDRTSEEAAAELLVESRMLDEELHEMTRRTLSTNEAEREQISLHLQDDIAPALLGIHVRPLALKASVRLSHEDVAEQITSTERLMAQSVRTICSFAGALGIDCEN